MGLRYLTSEQELMLKAQEELTPKARKMQRVVTVKELELIIELGALTADELEAFKCQRSIKTLEAMQQKLMADSTRINERKKEVVVELEKQRAH